MFYFLFIIFVLIVTQGLIPSVKKASAIIGVALWLFMGLRDISIGTDTVDYVTNSFYVFQDMSYSNLLRSTENKSEPLFVTINWLIAQITDNYSVMLLFWSMFPAIAIHSTLKRETENSSDLAISYLCLFLLGLFVFFIAGIRQTVAISLTFYSYHFFKNSFGRHFYKNPSFWNFFICILFAFYIHNSVLIFVLVILFVPLLKKLELKWWYLLPLCVIFIVVSRMDITQIVAISQLFFADRYEKYGENNFESSWSASAFILQLIIFMICFIERKKLATENKDNILLLNLVLIGVVFQSFAGVMAEFARISYYFSIYNLILLPRAMSIFSHKGKYSVVYVTFISISMLYLFVLSSQVLDYKFAF